MQAESDENYSVSHQNAADEAKTTVGLSFFDAKALGSDVCSTLGLNLSE